MRTGPGCSRVRARLGEFAAGELPEAAAQQARAHLLDCPGCRRELRSWIELRRELATATGPERAPAGRAQPDPAFFADLRRRVLDAVARETLPDVASTGRPRSALRRGGFAAAVVLFAAGFAVVALSPGGPGTGRSRLLDLPPRAGLAEVGSVGGGFRPVGLRSGPATWVGLRGRERADGLMDSSLWGGGTGTLTAPLPLRERGDARR
jgi:anti-sigma factor RsiW